MHLGPARLCARAAQGTADGLGQVHRQPAPEQWPAVHVYQALVQRVVLVGAGRWHRRQLVLGQQRRVRLSRRPWTADGGGRGPRAAGPLRSPTAAARRSRVTRERGDRLHPASAFRTWRPSPATRTRCARARRAPAAPTITAMASPASVRDLCPCKTLPRAPRTARTRYPGSLITARTAPHGPSAARPRSRRRDVHGQRGAGLLL